MNSNIELVKKIVNMGIVGFGTLLYQNSLKHTIGISYRFLAKKRDFNHNMEQSIYFLAKGLDLKQKLAESCILRAVRCTQPEEQQALLKQVKQVAIAGLELLQQMGSSKKRGQLLAETLLSYLLSGETEPGIIKPYEDELNQWLATQKEDYDYEVVKELLKLARASTR